MSGESNLKYLALGVVAAAAAGAFVYFTVNNEAEEEEDVQEAQEELTLDRVKEMLNEDIEKLKTIEMKDVHGLTHPFLFEVFRVLKKYVTLVQSIDGETQFEQRIQLLKDGNEEEYAKLKETINKENDEKIKEITTTLYQELDFTDLDYATGIQKNAYNPEFSKKLQEIDKEVVEEIQTYHPTNELPEDLTIEKAKEIRVFVQKETQKKLNELQSLGLPQAQFHEKFVKEIAKLDDIIYIKFGFKNKEVLQAFNKYRLIAARSGMAA
ncbi:unnamed protein product [Moneuplotes crassus]|uniref:Uncharacterized protein n=1 Tax=Euplotes crassus TaxID=5936 RepID=A0AAD1XTJ1_EUPCR|nr:unnamed protein product [Moneuplotes crassus]